MLTLRNEPIEKIVDLCRRDVRLTEHEIDVVTAYVIDNCSVIEIAKALGVSRNAVYKVLQNVERKLRKETYGNR